MKTATMVIGILCLLMLLLAVPVTVVAQGTDQADDDARDTEAQNKKYIALGAFLAMAIAGVASAFALGHTGASAVGVISEKEEFFGKALVLQAMPMTQGLYGFIIAFMLWLGFGNADLTDPAVGWFALSAGLVIGFTGFSAIPQGQIASAGIQSMPRNPEVSMGKKIILAAMPETMSIFGVLIAIFLLMEAGLL